MSGFESRTGALPLTGMAISALPMDATIVSGSAQLIPAFIAPLRGRTVRTWPPSAGDFATRPSFTNAIHLPSGENVGWSGEPSVPVTPAGYTRAGQPLSARQMAARSRWNREVTVHIARKDARTAARTVTSTTGTE